MVFAPSAICCGDVVLDYFCALMIINEQQSTTRRASPSVLAHIYIKKCNASSFQLNSLARR